MSSDKAKIIVLSVFALCGQSFTFAATYGTLLFIIGFDRQRWQIEALYGMCAMVMAFIVLDRISIWAKKEMSK